MVLVMSWMIIMSGRYTLLQYKYSECMRVHIWIGWVKVILKVLFITLKSFIFILNMGYSFITCPIVMFNLSNQIESYILILDSCLFYSSVPIQCLFFDNQHFCYIYGQLFQLWVSISVFLSFHLLVKYLSCK